MRHGLSLTHMILLWIMLAVIPVEAFAAVTGACANGESTLEDTLMPTISECEGRIDLSTLISSSICLLRAVMAESMFKVYCGIMEDMKEPLKAALTLWVIFYAIAVIFGIGNASGRDIIIRILKVSAIFAFATNAEVFVKLLYEFFIYGLLEGTSTFLFNMDIAGATGPGVGFEGQVYGDEGIFAYIDKLFFMVIGTDRIVALGVLMTAYATTGTGIIVSMLLMLGILSLFQAFFRILITYSVAIMALTFLLMLAPIFLAFALFERTFNIFQGWLAALVSYTIQPIIVLTFIFLFAAVSDMRLFLVKLSCVNYAEIIGYYENLPRNHDENYPPPPECEKKIDVDYERVMDLVFLKVSGKSPTFEEFKNEDPNFDPVVFKGDFKEGVYFALAFLVLNSIMNAFLKQVPNFAQLLARFEGSSQLPAIAMSSGQSWVNPGRSGPQGVGVFSPDRFFTGAGPGLQARNFIERMESGGGGGRASQSKPSGGSGGGGKPRGTPRPKVGKNS